MESWKIEKDLCRCCHSEGSFRALSDLCIIGGEEGFYNDMLRLTLNIQLKPVNGLLETYTYTICDSCVLRLRDATSFKQQVLLCEERFQDMYNKGVIKLEEPVIKQELPESEDDKMDDADLDDNHDTFEPDDVMDSSDAAVKIDLEICKPDPEPIDAKRRSTRKKAAVKSQEKTKSKTKTRKTKGKPETSGEGEDAAKKDVRQWNHLSDFTVLSQDGLTLYICNRCGLSQQTLESIQAHIKTVHMSKLACYICSKTYKYETLRNEHLTKCHGIKEIKVNIEKFTCDVCNKDFSTKISIRRHVREFHTLRKCPDCSIKLFEKELPRHRSHVHGLAMPTCEQCGYKSFSKYKMKRHQASHDMTCALCKKEFPTKKKLMFHNLRHHTTQKCPECPMEFSKEELLNHRAEVHGRSMPTCGVCGFKNTSQYRIDVHQRQVHLKEKHVSCPHCELKFYDHSKLRCHMVKHNPVKKFKCAYCKKRFPRMSALNAHEKIHTGDKKKVCKICEARFVQKASLNYHMAKHHPEAYVRQWNHLSDFTALSQDGLTLYICNRCGLSQQTLESIQAHIKTKHMKLACYTCNKTYKSETNRNKHLTKCHGIKEIKINIEKFTCDVCNKDFSTKISVRRHVREFHTLRKCPDCSIKLFEKELLRHRSHVHGMAMPTCELCGYKSFSKHDMKRHQASHDTTCALCKKEFPTKKKLMFHNLRHHTIQKCPECPMEFSKEELLNHRAEVHSISMPTCGVCGFKNTSQYRIDVHQRQVHLKETHVSCPHCELKFYNHSIMRRHMVKHNPVKKFKCAYCKKRFPRSKALVAHEKIHTGDKRKVCKICEARFVQKASLNYHMAKHHPEAC